MDGIVHHPTYCGKCCGEVESFPQYVENMDRLPSVKMHKVQWEVRKNDVFS